MNEEEIKAISAKIADNTATNEEVAKFLEVVNTVFSNLKKEVEGITE
ncbi:MAG: hypothetical protein KBB75_02670 [Candidatus Pacebacteria bacterium]|jgi:hypothetical protein|nr:hypothetical protein [Candidatus Paceibacterota bacterium]